MARLWSTGFELGSDSIRDWSTNATAAGVTSSLARTGTYSINPVLVSGSHRGIIEHYASSTINGPIYARFYFRYATLPSASNTVAILGTSTTFPAGIKLNTDGTLGLYDEDGQIGSNSSALSANTWYRVEMYYDTTGGAGAGASAARIDGSEFASSTTRSSGAAQSLRMGTNVLTEAQTTGSWYFDDIAINDTSGSAQTSYPGAGSILYARPNAAGDTNNAVSGDYTSIDEVTPDSGSTIAVLDDNNDILDVNIEDASTLGIGASDTINLVAVGGQYAAASAASATWNLRIKSQASGTVLAGTAVTYNGTAYIINNNAGGIPHIYTLHSYVDPQAGGAWTAALLDTTQIGATATDATPDMNLSALWALVEYIPTGDQTISATGISSTAALGSPTLTPGAVDISPTAISSTASLGSPTLSSAYTLSVTGISSTATLGLPTLTPGSVDIATTGIGSTATLGSPTLSAGAVDISPTGIASTTSFGTPSVINLLQIISPTGISSTVLLGVPSLAGENRYRLLRGPRASIGPRGTIGSRPIRGPRGTRPPRPT